MKTNYFPEETAKLALSVNNFSFLYPFILHIINGIAKKQFINADEDTKQLVMIGVWKSLKTYNQTKGRLFTYITKATQNHFYWIYSADKQKKSRSLNIISLEEYIENNGEISNE